MTLRRPFRPLRPDLDKFLFAMVGGEANGIPLSVISALTRLGLDPWEEAGRLSALNRHEAVEQLARYIAELSESSRTLGEAREIASNLVNFIPKHGAGPEAKPQIQVRSRFRRPVLPQLSTFWVICFVLLVAAFASALVHGGLPFSIVSP